MIGIVCRGYITRFSPREEWEAELEQISEGEELVDADAIPYYVKRDDGKFVECYQRHSTKDNPAYRVAD